MTGLLLRDQARADGWAPCACGHAVVDHRELLPGAPGYAVAKFVCHAPDCDCSQYREAAA